MARLALDRPAWITVSDALRKAGCEPILTDKASGGSAAREGLDQALGQLRKGDILVVWRLDRLGRSLRHLIDTITALNDCARTIAAWKPLPVSVGRRMRPGTATRLDP
jgi:Resolvase, N terminal domain